MGDPRHHLGFEALAIAHAALRAAPPIHGRVALLVSRGEGGLRQVLSSVVLTPEGGMPGDAWGRREAPNPEAQLTVMRHDIASMIANGQPLELSGDNLFLDLDVTAANLPVGTTLRVGEATLITTSKPHNGCKKFQARFGHDALRFISQPSLRHLNLRGIYMRVLEAGEVRVGSPVEVLARP